MKKLTFLLVLFAVNFCVAQVAPPKPSMPPPSDYQKEEDSASAIALRFLENEKIPGMAISISKHGELLYSKGFGVATIETETEVSPVITQFRIASISKSLSALAMAKLVDDDKLGFDKSIYTYLPDYPKKEYDFTVRQVAGHIAGIRHYKGKEFILNKPMTITEGLDIFKDDPLLSEPGTKYKYSTYGWNLLSAVVQKAAETPFTKYMEEIVFKPLHMSKTVLETSDKELPFKTGYYRKTNQGKITLGPEVNNEFKAAGGGFLSTSEDLIRFGNEIINPTIIKKETVAELVKSQTTADDKKTNYGIGFVTDSSKKGTPRYSHSGGGIGATALLLMYPEEEIVIVILTNLSDLKIKDFGSELEAVFLN
ncbi:serine hydrolase domain-containing protein [Aureibaculum sp. 2210JD6-5]|uniref:serine hydrolase domain-containing protein n=1 Tax=Aureibaculum sp. 2210JD6-5 TaxID=3103957 RepID=UPI002AAC5B9A|nr:serine hydrolase domain-containing protein [Aureibaculum sp. 2210JD6-5]MDY7396155.1 serine hydrolase domain-containing protein [Aureibaculum sp. 2210JD6-5]